MAAGLLERPGRLVGQVQHQLDPVGVLGGDQAQPALAGAVGGAGLDLEAEHLGVEPLGLVLVVDDDTGQSDPHRGVLSWSLGELAVPGGAGLSASWGPWLAVPRVTPWGKVRGGRGRRRRRPRSQPTTRPPAGRAGWSRRATQPVQARSWCATASPRT